MRTKSLDYSQNGVLKDAESAITGHLKSKSYDGIPTGLKSNHNSHISMENLDE